MVNHYLDTRNNSITLELKGPYDSADDWDYYYSIEKFRKFRKCYEFEWIEGIQYFLVGFKEVNSGKIAQYFINNLDFRHFGADWIYFPINNTIETNKKYLICLNTIDYILSFVSNGVVYSSPFPIKVSGEWVLMLGPRK